MLALFFNPIYKSYYIAFLKAAASALKVFYILSGADNKSSSFFRAHPA